MKTLTVFAPAKINLFLAITGRRADGFHELVSVVTPLDWGDTLQIKLTSSDGGGTTPFALASNDPAVPTDGNNLVLKAAELFCAETGWKGAVRFFLEKKIPIGAGLGGGSSDAAAALKGLNALAGEPLSAAELARVAAKVGSDCALFLHDGPVVMRGRGERVEPLSPAVRARFAGRRVLVFKPAFGISTAWAYGKLAERAPESYLPPDVAEGRLRAWIAEGEAEASPLENLLLNTMEPPAFGKFPVLPLLLERLREEFGLAARMSGSGSACFALLSDESPVDAIEARIRSAWGASAFIVQAGFHA